ncbi:MAG: hypothetical protein C0412_02960 [Flavobacterium sp.]|nr:hypothetical protein [Flavobacterium sp.]
MLSGTVSMIWKSTVFVTFSQVIRVITNLLIFIGIARFYSTESLGQFSFAFQVANICLIIADFGFDTLLTTKIAAQRENPIKIVREFFSMKIVFAGVASIIMIAIPTLQSLSRENSILIYAFVPYMIFSTFNNFTIAIFKGFQKFESETKNSFVSNLLLLALLVLFGSFHIPLVYVVLFFVLSKLLGVILGIKVVKELLGASVMVFDFTNWKKIINEILVFGFQYIFGNLYFLIDTILIGIWLGDAATGIYQAGFRVMSLFLIIIEILRSPLLPVFSKLFFDDKEKWISMNRFFFKVLLFIGIPISLAFCFIPDMIVKTIYGNDKYLDTIPLLRLFGVVTFIRFFCEPFVLVLTTSKRQHILLGFAIIGTILSYLLNTIFLSKYGLFGAVVIAICVNSIVNFGMLFFIEKKHVSVIYENRLLLVWSYIIGVFILMQIFPFKLLFVILLLLFIPIAFFVGLNSWERKMVFSKHTFKPQV